MKKIITTVALVSVLGTAAFAGYNKGCENKGQNFNKQHQMKKMHKKQMRSSHGFMPLLKKLSLTTSQKDSIKKIMQETFSKKISKYSAFTQDSFNKNQYVKDSMNHRDNMIKSKAETISKVYKVLTKKQKIQLKVLMDLQEEKMKNNMRQKGMNFDKNSNGRG